MLVRTDCDDAAWDATRKFKMKSTSTIIAALLAVTQAFWMLEPALAQAGKHDRSEKGQKHNKPEAQQEVREEHRQSRPHAQHGSRHVEGSREGMHSPVYSGPVQIGGYFREQHREAAREYYERPENRGFCPPGLAKKGHDCMPPGQVKKWRRGYPLPAGVVYYEVPRSVVLSLGVPPSGYRYVRVASDILLLTVGTSMVVDALEDLVH
jgi:Ni/Co efflux regulator RcnB